MNFNLSKITDAVANASKVDIAEGLNKKKQLMDAANSRGVGRKIDVLVVPYSKGSEKPYDHSKGKTYKATVVGKQYHDKGDEEDLYIIGFETKPSGVDDIFTEEGYYDEISVDGFEYFTYSDVLPKKGEPLVIYGDEEVADSAKPANSPKVSKASKTTDSSDDKALIAEFFAWKKSKGTPINDSVSSFAKKIKAHMSKVRDARGKISYDFDDPQDKKDVKKYHDTHRQDHFDDPGDPKNKGANGPYQRLHKAQIDQQEGWLEKYGIKKNAKFVDPEDGNEITVRSIQKSWLESAPDTHQFYVIHFFEGEPKDNELCDQIYLPDFIESVIDPSFDNPRNNEYYDVYEDVIAPWKKKRGMKDE